MNNELSKIVGKRINSLLAEQDKKQKDLAAALGVTDNTISYFVSGKRIPNTEQIKAISKFFGVSADYLLGLSDVPTTDKDLQFVCDYLGLTEKACGLIHRAIIDLPILNRSTFNYLIESEVYINLAFYLDKFVEHSEKKDYAAEITDIAEQKKHIEKSKLYLFEAQELLRDSFKVYIKAGEQNGNY